MRITKNYIVSIDGPVAAGKTSTAKSVASALGCMYLDTGAIFRAFAYYILSRGYKDRIVAYERDPSTNMNALAYKIARSIHVAYDCGMMTVYIDQEDVTSKLRSNDVSDMASRIGVIPAIRTHTLMIERRIARNAGVSIVAEGRDIGTVVFPKADVKIFLTADVEERAARRVKEHPEDFADIQEAIEEIKARDHRDSTRTEAPLKQADDAVLIDNTDLDARQTVAEVIRTINLRTVPTWQYMSYRGRVGWKLDVDENTTVFIRQDIDEYVGDLLVGSTRFKIASHKMKIPASEVKSLDNVTEPMLKALLAQARDLWKLLNGTKTSLKDVLDKKYG